MKLALVGIVLWFFESAFLISLFGGILWFLRKFSPLKEAESSGWTKLTALSLLVPPALGVVLATMSLRSALLCPLTSVRTRHSCLHAARHWCGHASAAAMRGSYFLLWVASVWLGLGSAVILLLARRTTAIKKFMPSPKLKRAITIAQLPSNLPVWESDSEATAGLVGFASPFIFVSRRTVQLLPTSALAAILRHEYAHYARRDHWLRWLIFSVALIFAPVPFVIWLQREWRLACEKAADDLAASNDEFARLLTSALMAVKDLEGFGDEQLQRRIERLKFKRLGGDRVNLIGACAIFAGLALGIFVFYTPSIWLSCHCFAEALMLR